MITKKYQFPKITDEMYKEIKEWYENHNDGRCVGRHCGPISGQITFEITPTSIGDFLTVRCTCGATLEYEEL